MHSRNQLAGLGLLFVMALVLTATPTLAASANQQQLPPLPEWPVIGPILRLLGVAPSAIPAVPVPNPNLREIRITSWEDVEALDQVESGERIRVIASDTDINRMAQEVIRERAEEGLSFRAAFAPNQATIEASVDAAIVEQLGFDLPALIRGALRIKTSGSATAAECRPVIDIQSLNVNGWSIGLAAIAQRAVNTQLPSSWPGDLCVEQILIMDGEVALEGYHIR